MTAGSTRARSAEAKRERETSILAAAERLALARGVRAVTLTDVAAVVGMHKSTMLRYFETREEIFLRLAASEWVEWSDRVRSRLGQLQVDETAPLERIPAVASVLAETLVARPLFCDLLAQTPLNLERGVSFAAVRTFKAGVVAEHGAVGAAITEVLPLEPRRSGDVVTTATAMAGALWQMAAPGTELRHFYETTPELTHAVVDVAPRLVSIVDALLRGWCSRPSHDDQPAPAVS